MTNEQSLITQIQNGIEPSMKMQLILKYKNDKLAEGFNLGWQNCQSTFKKSHCKIKEAIIKEKNRLLDELHDEIWQRKLNAENNIQS
jgi:hypothetical protein